MPQPVANSADDRSSKASDLLRTGFHVEARHAGRAVVLRLEGELDTATASELRQVMTEVLDTSPASVALDLSELTFIDSTGIGVLISGCRRAEQVNSSFVLRSPSRPVLKALRLTAVDRLMGIETGPILS